MAAFTLLTACSASQFDWGEYADENSWLIPASDTHFLIAELWASIYHEEKGYSVVSFDEFL